MRKLWNCLLYGFLLISASSSLNSQPSQSKSFDQYFKKINEIRIETTGLNISYFWQFLVDKKGRILALDSKESQLLVFDENGKFMKRIGGKGQGPGEFALPLAMSFDPAGRLYVEDSRMRRINIFSEDDQFLKSYTFSVNHTQGSMLRADSLGNCFLSAMTTPIGPNRTADWLVAYDARGKFLKSFYPDSSGRNWVFRMDPPFTFDIHNDILYAMQIDRYQIDLFDNLGRPLNSFRLVPEYFVPPDVSYTMDERKFRSQKELYDELIRLSKSWTRIMRLDVVDDRTMLIMSAANGLLHKTKKPYVIDLWTLGGEMIASAILSDFKFLCSDKEGTAYFLIQSDEETALEKDPAYVIGKFKVMASGK